MLAPCCITIFFQTFSFGVAMSDGNPIAEWRNIIVYGRDNSATVFIQEAYAVFLPILKNDFSFAFAVKGEIKDENTVLSNFPSVFQKIIRLVRSVNCLGYGYDMMKAVSSCKATEFCWLLNISF